MILDKTAILSAEDLKTEEVDVPEWGGSVRVRTLTGSERDAFESSLIAADGQRNMANYRARLLSRALVGENGQRLFSDDEIPLLGGKSAAALDRLFAVAQRLNGIGGEAEKAIEKN